MLEEVGHFSAAVREVIRKAEVVFGDQKIADRWLNHSRNQFGGKAPLEMIATSSGRKAVVTLLNQIDHGMFT